MMDHEAQLKLQAFLDGELPEKEAREVAARLARDSEATALLAEFRNTRQALAGFEPALKLPESREFYWSKIERQIQRLEPAPRAAESPSLFLRLRRLLVPAGAVAALVIAGFFAIKGGNFGGSLSATEVETALDDTGAFTYTDQAQGMTVVWLSYPAENEFAQTGSADTL
jgi:anti-sigma factor RsiW